MMKLKYLFVRILSFIAVSCWALTASGLDYPDHSEKVVFGEAKWIGVADSLLPLNPDRLTAFGISFHLTLDKKARPSFIFGADDPRLMNANLNIYNLDNPVGASKIRIEFSPSDSLLVYRSGYAPDDLSTKPIAAFPISGLKRDGSDNRVEIRVNFGHTDFIVNGTKVGYAGLNPIGNGGDYLAFPALARIGTEITAGDNACFSNISICNFREPQNAILRLPRQFQDSEMIDVDRHSMPELKTFFTTSDRKHVKRAVLTVTARGIYEIYINGKRICDDYFNPGYTQYNRTHTYRDFDIDSFLNKGENEIHAVLGEGWWSGPHTYLGENWNFFGDRQSLIGKLVITYDDDSRQEIITSPDTWLARANGATEAASFFQGEIYNSMLADNNTGWGRAVEIPASGNVAESLGNWDNVKFIPMGEDRILPVDTLTAVRMTEPRKGVYVYDMGQNFAGVPYISFSDLAPGTKVSMRYAEVEYPDMPVYEACRGMVMTENLRAAMNHDIYIASGGDETFSPRFTLHGYRYIELTGLDSPLQLNAVKALPLSSIREFKAGFECSDTLVNRLWENIKWSTLSNFISVPTDCPQRNERLGWMGDISVFSPSATKLADLNDLLARYINSIRDCTRDDGRFPDVVPTGVGFGSLLWGSAGIIVPWEHFKQYGDSTVIRDHFPAMEKYIGYMVRNAIDHETGIIVQDRAWGDLGDWLSPVYEQDDKSLLWECYFIYCLDLMSRCAKIAGHDDISKHYSLLRKERIDFFNNTYIDPVTSKTIFSSFDTSRKGTEVDTQASYALPIALGINRTPQFVEKFIRTITRSSSTDNGTIAPPFSLMTGFIGTAWISKALSEVGRNDLAYRLLTSKNFPSWLYPVTQGATTIWERLDSYTHENGFGRNNSMNSFNHYSFGSVADWIITYALGINACPGIDNIAVTITPQPDPEGNITFMRGYLDLPSGRVESAWHREQTGIVYDITVPAGMKVRFRPYGGAWSELCEGRHIIK